MVVCVGFEVYPEKESLQAEEVTLGSLSTLDQVKTCLFTCLHFDKRRSGLRLRTGLACHVINHDPARWAIVPHDPVSYQSRPR